MALKRVLTLRTVVATSAGLTLASSCFIAAAQVAHYVAGDSAWLAILVGGALCLLSAACFAELNGMYPSAAGLRLYLARAFNERLALIVSLLYMAVVTGVIGTESFVLSHALTRAIPQVPPIAWILGLFVLATALNIRGVKIAGNFQDAITYGLMASLFLLGIASFTRFGFDLATPFFPGSAEGFINAVAVGVFLYVGFEWVTPLAEEVTHIRLISRGMLVAIGILSVTYAIFTVGMGHAVPKAVLDASPAPQMEFGTRMFGVPGVYVMLTISLAASVTTFNAGLLSVSRFIYASAREAVLPHFFSRLSSRYFTPYIAIIAVFLFGVAVTVGILLTERYKVLVLMAATMEAVVYSLVGVAVVVLRCRQPEADRPYRAGRGWLVPVLSAIVFAGLALAVLVENRGAAIGLGAGFALVTGYVYAAVPYLRRRQEARRRQKRAAARPRLKAE
uniref:APC family permease n=1 Tax=Ammonifex degensii TaxID=42838 RepID=A0A7C2EJ59_9THEO